VVEIKELGGIGPFRKTIGTLSGSHNSKPEKRGGRNRRKKATDQGERILCIEKNGTRGS